ncbi:RHS repeat-associated core domain-containing protein [Microbulbifer sp. CNSA002]|uniref:RHS repeat-associated core domain-containing protein n=1 Tax=Microbulbifer sp. CNSA002 TaxID=3373604 RepID=UPI0039B5F1D7
MKSGRLSIIVRAVISAALSLGCVSVSAGEIDSNLAGADLPSQEEVVDRLISGKPLGLDEVQWTAIREQSRAVKIPQSAASREFGRSLESLLTTLQLLDSFDKLAPAENRQYRELESQFNAFVAHHLIVDAKLRETIADPELSQQGRERAQATHDAYWERVQPFVSLLEELFSFDPEEAGWIDHAGHLYSQFQLAGMIDGLSELQVPQSYPVLRDMLLPYEPLAPASIAISSAPSIVSSYQDPAATQIPSSADLSASSQAPLSASVLAKARDLNYDPVSIFNFVKSTVSLEWYYGSMKGAEETLRQMAGNDIDQASLLVALLRASSIPSRYVRGVVEIPVETVENSLAVSGAERALELVRAAGYPAQAVIRGGQLEAIAVEYTWVVALVPYANYRGAVVDTSGRAWLPLFPAASEFEVNVGGNPMARVALDPRQTIERYLSEYIEEVSPITAFVSELDAGLAEQGTSLDELSPQARQVEEVANYLPNSEPYTVQRIFLESAEIPAELVHKVTFRLYTNNRNTSSESLVAELPVSALSNRDVTLSYMASTIDEQNLVNRYGGLGSVPAYLVSLRPQIQVDGIITAVGEQPIPMAQAHRIQLEISGPGYSDTIAKTVIAGNYHAVGVVAQASIAESEETERTAASVLSQIARRYLAAWHQSERELSGATGVRLVRPVPDVVFSSNAVVAEEVLGRPHQLSWQGVNLDASYRKVAVVPVFDDAMSAKDFISLSAVDGSYLEHRVYEQNLGVAAVSADKAIAYAHQQNQTVLTITPEQEAQVDSLNIAEVVKSDIRGWLVMGYQVTVPAEEVQVGEWQGAAWQVENTSTGAAGYFLSGGIAGGANASTTWPSLLQAILQSPYLSEVNLDPSAAAIIDILPDTNYQEGAAGELLERPLSVMVRDLFGRRIVGAPVTFAIDDLSLGSFNGEREITVQTSAQGVAEVDFTLPETTFVNPLFAYREQGHKYNTQAGIAVVSARVDVKDVSGNISNTLRAPQLFQALVWPGDPVEFEMLLDENDWVVKSNARMVDLKIQVQVRDAFDNPVSNESVVATVKSSEAFDRYGDPAPEWLLAPAQVAYTIGNTCVIDYVGMPKLGECGAAQNSSAVTTAEGIAGFAVFTGELDTEAWGGTGRPTLFTYEFSWADKGETLYIRSAPWDYVWHSNGAMVLAGDTYETPMYLVSVENTHLVDAERWYVTKAMLIHQQKDDGLNIVSESSQPISVTDHYSEYGNEVFSYTVTTAETPGSNSVVFDTDAATPDEEVVQFHGSDVIGITIDEIEAFTGGPIMLDLGGRVINPVRMEIAHHPASISIEDAALLIYRDGSVVYDLPLTRSVGENSYTTHSGALLSNLEFDVDSHYEAQVVFNRGLGWNYKRVYGNRQPITFDQQILEHLSAFEESAPEPQVGVISTTVTASTLVDLSNSFVCESPLKFKLGLSQDAQASITFTGENAPIGADEVLDPSDLSAGYHEFTYTDRSLRPGTYDFEVRLVSKATGREEVYPGQAIISREYLDQLPVGHAMVEGVDLFDGKLNLSATDVQLPWSGPDLSLRRSYSSRNTSTSSLGMGWSHNLESFVLHRGCGVVTVHGGDGGGITFYPDGNGGYAPGRGYHGTLISSVGGWDFYSKDGTQYHYTHRLGTKKAMLDYIRGTNGRLIKFGYSGSSEPQLDIVEDSSGRTLRFEYQVGIAGWEVRHLLKRVTALSGSEEFSIYYEYDGRGRLIESRYEKGRASRSQRYQYQVDESFQFNGVLDDFYLRSAISQVIDENDKITHYSHGVHEFPGPPLLGDQAIVVGSAPVPATLQITRPEGGTTSFEYPGRNERNGGLLETEVTDGRYNKTTYTLNDYGAATKIKAPNGTREIEWDLQQVVIANTTNERNVTTEFAYDEDGNQVVEKLVGRLPLMTPYVSKGQFGQIKNLMAARIDRNDHRTDYHYDDRGNLTGVDYPDATSEYFTYDDLGNRKTYQDRRGKLWRYNHDEWGNVIYTRDPLGGVAEAAWNARGQKLWETDEEGRRISYTYNDLNQLTDVIRPLDDDTSYTYDLVGNKKTETDGRGHTTYWEYDGENRVVEIRNHLQDSKSLDYDKVGNLISESDFRGNVTTYDYDGANRQTSVNMPESRVLKREYDDAGNITREYSTEGRTTSYGYDDYNRRNKITNALEQVTDLELDEEGNVLSLTNARTHTTTYEYDGLNRKRFERQPLGRTLEWRYDENGNLIYEIDGNGQATRYTYDDLNRVQRKIDREGNITLYDYDKVGNRTLELNARQFSIVREYDDRNRLERLKDAEDYVTDYRYDEVGNLTQEILANGNTLVSEFDELNRLTSKSDDIGHLVRENRYDADGNLAYSEDANGNVTTYDYNAFNQLTFEYQPLGRTLEKRYDTHGNLTYEIDAEDQDITEHRYDVLNRLEKTIDPLLKERSLTYDEVGNKKTVTDWNLNTTTWEYDALNRVISEEDPLEQFIYYDEYDLNNNLLVTRDKRNIETRYQYDAEDRQTQVTRAGLQILRTEYDEVGNTLIEEDAEGNKTAWEYDGRNLVLVESGELAAINRYHYDAMGNRDYRRDPEGRETTWLYDKRNRLDNVTNGEQETTRYSYDLNGNRTSVEKSKGNSTTYVYDALNRLDEIHDYLGGITDFVYDRDNNLVEQIDAELNSTSYEYDALNRRSAIEYADTNRVEYTEYDGNGNLKAMTDANGVSVSYQYDELNRETERNYARPLISSSADIQQVVSAYDANNNLLSTTERYFDGLRGDVVTRYTYDDFDRQLTKTDSFGRTLGYAYDNNGNRTRLTDPDNKHTLYVFDSLNRLYQAQAEGGTTTYSYDRSSLVEHVSYPNNTETRYTYDNAGRTETIEHTQNGGLVSRFAYEYDDNGNRTEQRETNGNGEEITTYVYDDLDRLESVTYPDVPAGSGHTVTYGYDNAYNRVSEIAVNSTSSQTEKDLTLSYNERNQLTDITDNLDAANNVKYGFDGNGNQVSKTKAGETSDFIFDARDDLRQVMIGGSTVGQFLYDVGGLRIEKEGERGTERYTYDGLSVLTQSDANNLTLAKYNYGPSKLLSLTHITEGTQFYLFDALGSVSNLTSANGTLQARYQYDAWGNKRSESGSSWNRFGFTGHEEDKETGLIYAKARFYDPDTGRFLSQDAWEGDSTIAPSLHKYLYAYQNPTVWVDPDGNQTTPLTPVIPNPVAPLAGDALATSADRTARVLVGEQLNIQSSTFWQEEYARTPTSWSNAVTALADRGINNAKGNVSAHFALIAAFFKPWWLSNSSDDQYSVVAESESRPGAYDRPPAEVLPKIPGREIDEQAGEAKVYVYEYLDPQSAPPGYEPENLDNPVLGYPDQSDQLDTSPYLRDRERDEQGRFKASTDIPEGRLNRAYPRADTKRAIQQQAKDQGLYNPETGNFIDPNTLEEIEGKFHYGHTAGNESWRTRDEATRKGMSQAEYNESQQDLEYWQIEDPGENMSHKWEEK